MAVRAPIQTRDTREWLFGRSQEMSRFVIGAGAALPRGSCWGSNVATGGDQDVANKGGDE